MSRFFKKFALSLPRGVLEALAVSLLSISITVPALADEAADFETLRQADLKVASTGWRLGLANSALCDQLEPGTGLQLHTLDQFDGASRESARAHFKFATPVAVEAVVAGSPADVAGLKPDDSLVRVGGIAIASLGGKAGTTDRLVATQTAIAALPANQTIEMEVLRNGQPVRLTLQPLPVCKSRFEMRVGTDWSSSADGTMVQIGSRFVDEYTEGELAAVMAHEFSHNILHHRRKLEARGVNYGLLAGFGGNVKYFRQTEVQADLLSVYLLANANYPVQSTIAFWRRFGPSNAGGIFRARTHPAWRDRIATLEAEIAKIAMIPTRPIVPTLLKDRDRPLDGNWQALLVRHR